MRTTANYYFFLKIKFIYLTERDIAREGTQVGLVEEGEGARSRERDA